MFALAQMSEFDFPCRPPRGYRALPIGPLYILPPDSSRRSLTKTEAILSLFLDRASAPPCGNAERALANFHNQAKPQTGMAGTSWRQISGRIGPSPPYPLLIKSDIGRKHLPHDGLPVNPISTKGEVYFITICCIPRGTNQLANSAT